MHLKSGKIKLISITQHQSDRENTHLQSHVDGSFRFRKEHYEKNNCDCFDGLPSSDYN